MFGGFGGDRNKFPRPELFGKKSSDAGKEGKSNPEKSAAREPKSPRETGKLDIHSTKTYIGNDTDARRAGSEAKSSQEAAKTLFSKLHQQRRDRMHEDKSRGCIIKPPEQNKEPGCILKPPPPTDTRCIHIPPPPIDKGCILIPPEKDKNHGIYMNSDNSNHSNHGGRIRPTNDVGVPPKKSETSGQNKPEIKPEEKKPEESKPGPVENDNSRLQPYGTEQHKPRRPIGLPGQLIYPPYEHKPGERIPSGPPTKPEIHKPKEAEKTPEEQKEAEKLREKWDARREELRWVGYGKTPPEKPSEEKKQADNQKSTDTKGQNDDKKPSEYKGHNHGIWSPYSRKLNSDGGGNSAPLPPPKKG